MRRAGCRTPGDCYHPAHFPIQRSIRKSAMNSIPFLLAFFANEPAPSGISSMYLIVGIVFIWIFLVMLPASKDKKKRLQMQQNVKKGDRILTQAGIIGRISSVDQDHVVLEVEDGKIKFVRSVIVKNYDEKDGAEAKAEKTEKSDKK